MNRGNHSLFRKAGFLAVGVIRGWVAAQQLPANATVYGAGLVVPTGMTFGPDGALYISNFGVIPAGALPVGSGQVPRIPVNPGWSI
jgi:hypothetical protein